MLACIITVFYVEAGVSVQRGLLNSRQVWTWQTANETTVSGREKQQSLEHWVWVKQLSVKRSIILDSLLWVWRIGSSLPWPWTWVVQKIDWWIRKYKFLTDFGGEHATLQQFSFEQRADCSWWCWFEFSCMFVACMSCFWKWLKCYIGFNLFFFFFKSQPCSCF